ncbi:MAG: sialidase family protein [Ignisphaera sp.]
MHRVVYPKECEHIVVYRKNDEYAGWPFNGGLWRFGNSDVVVGFIRNRCAYRSLEDVSHRRVQYVDGQFVTIRSRDGGRTWLQDELKIIYNSKAELRAQLQYYLTLNKFPRPMPIDFTSSDTALATEPPLGIETGPTAYFVTRDRGYTWEGPYPLHIDGFDTIHARPSYIVDSNSGVMLFVQGLRYDEINRGYRSVEPEGRPMILVSEDGVSWRFLSYILPPNPEFPRICPSPAVLPDGRIVVALRVLGPGRDIQWTELYTSEDGGLTWRFTSRVNRWGAPASLLILRDGRLLCIYGYRVPPYGIRARVSGDGGMTWGPEIIIRDDGGSPDLGYPRATELQNGEILTIYYFNDKSDEIQCYGGVRYIAATVFTLPY